MSKLSDERIEDGVVSQLTRHHRKRLRVSSSTLSRSSDVFRALLSPRFKEGSDLAASGSVEVPLPDDDPVSLAVVCKILHGQNNKVAYSMPVQEIAGIAIITDKYACTEAMRFAANVWIPCHNSLTDPNLVSTLLLSTYYFRDGPLFDTVCHNIVWRSIGRMSTENFQGPDVLVDVLGSYIRPSQFAMSMLTMT